MQCLAQELKERHHAKYTTDTISITATNTLLLLHTPFAQDVTRI
jgi:hypothetical protein